MILRLDSLGRVIFLEKNIICESALVYDFTASAWSLGASQQEGDDR